MFAKSIITSDAFLDMPASSRCLYFTLNMFSDDDGFVNNPRSIMRQSGASDDDMRLLIAKKFVLVFDDGVLVIKHWRIHNYIRSDRYVPTKYQDHLSELSLDENKSYTLNSGVPLGIPDGIPMVATGKDRIELVEVNKEKENKEKKKFTPPTLEEVKEFIRSNDLHMVAEEFIDYYASKGWKVGNAPMKDWMAACRNWARRSMRTPAKRDPNQGFVNPHTEDEMEQFFKLSVERGKQCTT